jgi:hypothetical protein
MWVVVPYPASASSLAQRSMNTKRRGSLMFLPSGLDKRLRQGFQLRFFAGFGDEA